MRAPLFWTRPAGLASTVLTPISWIWTTATRRRLQQGAWEVLDVPVICVGNISAGGTGKTPTVIALVSLCADMGIKAHVVSRGYGGSLAGPVLVDEKLHSADEVGDEPLLVAAFGPCWVAKDRVAGAKEAIVAGAEIVILDDGFQNPAMHKDLSIVVVDAEVGFGNGCVIPAGPLREPLAEGLARADVVLTIGKDTAQRRLDSILANSDRWSAAIQPLETGMDWQGTRFIAFAGIGRPGKFFATLADLGADVIATHAFPDHAPFTAPALQRLKAEAKAKSAQLVTTEKDMARLPAAFRRDVLALPVRLMFDDEAVVKQAIKDVLAVRLAKDTV